MLLGFAALNAGSYFVRSRGWGNLFGTRDDRTVAIGFPFLIWHNGVGLPEPELGLMGLAGNIAVGSLFCTLPYFRKFNFAPNTSSTPSRTSRRMQFSMLELFAHTVLVAAVMGVAGPFDDLRLSGLKVVYILGPILIGWIYFLL